MVNRNMLIGKIAMAGYTQKSLSLKMGVSKNTLNAKINGHRFFDTQEIETICFILGINDIKEKAEIFLAESSHNRDNPPAHAS